MLKNATLARFKHTWKDDRETETFAVCIVKYGIRHSQVRFIGDRGKALYGTQTVTVWTDKLVNFQERGYCD